MNGAAHGRHRHGRTHVGEEIVVTPAAGHGDEAIGGFNFNLEDKAGVVFKLTAEGCLELKTLGVEAKLFHVREALLKIFPRLVEIAARLGPVQNSLKVVGAFDDVEIAGDGIGLRLIERCL